MPASVRLLNSTGERFITNNVSNLTWRSVIPGGFATATFELHSPIDVRDPMLAPFTRVIVYDQRNGSVLWEGRLQISGRSAGDQGEVWSLAALGPSAHAYDQTVPLIYIDRRLDGWVKDPLNGSLIPASADAGPNTDPAIDGKDVVLCRFSDGSVLSSAPSMRTEAGYTGFVGSGMEIGAYAYAWGCGFTNVNFAVESAVGVSPSYTVSPASDLANVAGGSATKWVIDDFTGGKDIIAVLLRRTGGGATTISGDGGWASFRDLRVLGRRMTKDRQLVSGAAGMGNSTIYVRASWVVADLLGRLLYQYDGDNATLAVSDTVDIDQLAYPDGVTPGQVLEDLMNIEPDTYWAAWESGPEKVLGPPINRGLRRHRFEWRKWPTAVRYEASVGDGFDSPAPSFDQYNKIVVRWRDTRGRIQRTTRTQSITELDSEVVIRSAFQDLADESGSATTAQKVGDNFLAEHLRPGSAGTLTLARCITDVVNRTKVDPWQVKPGELIRVLGIESSTPTGSGTAWDGQTVFRIVSSEVNSDGVATLELDTFAMDENRALTTLMNKRLRKR